MATYPVRYHPQDAVFGSGWHMDYSVTDPTFIVATVANHQTGAMGPSGYSTDRGFNWTQFTNMPLGSTSGTATFGFGSIHVGDPDNIVWVSSYSHGAQYTLDRGVTWNTISVPGVGTLGTVLNSKQYFVYRRPVAAEKTASAAGTFYMFVQGSGVFRSTDGGATWVNRCNQTPFAGTDYTFHLYLKCAPGNVGHLWLTAGSLGSHSNPDLTTPFLRSIDGGTTWSTVAGISGVAGFDFGKAAPGQSYPAIYAVGAVGGLLGVYRSDDQGATWALLSAQPAGTVDFIRNVAASKDVYGKHWITTAGSGLIVGTT